jgi:hypothetical protein
MVDHDLGVDSANCDARSFRKALADLEPLPNLDFKIRRADSLVDKIHGEPIPLGKIHVGSQAQQALNELTTAKREFYAAERAAEKRRLRLAIYKATADLAQIELTAARNELGLIPDPANAAKVFELDRGQREVGQVLVRIRAVDKLQKAKRISVADIEQALGDIREFFDSPSKPTFVWHLDFAEVFFRAEQPRSNGNGGLPLATAEGDQASRTAGGFDIVLGNPPYVRQELLAGNKAHFEATYAAFNGTADIYVYFIEAGVRMLRDGGILSIIVSSSFLRASYGEELRRFLKAQSAVLRIVDFGGLPVFQNAKDTYVCLPLIAKSSQRGRVEVCNVPSLAIQNLNAYVAANRFTIPHERLAEEAWSLKSDAEAVVFEKIMRAGQPLGDYVNRKMFYGIKTGLNEAFEIGEAQRMSILAKTPDSARLIRPFVGGLDIRRYFVNDRNRCLIAIPCGWTRQRMADSSSGTALLSERRAFEWLCQEHPAIARHLEAFAPALKKRQDQGDYWWELRPCDYYQHLDAPKIVFPDICKAPRFALDRTGIYLANTAYCIASDSLYLLGILNSRLFWFAIGNISIPFGVRAGEYRYRLIYQYMERVPIRPIDSSSASERAEHDSLVCLVERILSAKRANPLTDTSAWEREIDERVYRLYGLTPDEIKLVEESGK